MSYCINPTCPSPHNLDHKLFCLGCGMQLLLNRRYRPVKALSSGGFSVIYQVDDQGLPKVLKVLNLTQFTTLQAQKKAVSLFEREARVLSQLHRQGIPYMEPSAYFTIAPPDRKPPLHCLVMEKIEGVNLEEWLKQQPTSLTQSLALKWLKQLVLLLEEVHQHQFFHRDIKPSNIMRQPDGNLALIDFGTVREVAHQELSSQNIIPAGTVIISRGYAPPEQEKGHTVEQSDFFALGRTFVYLLTRQHPLTFYEPYTDEFRWRSSAPGVSDEFAEFLDRLMAPFPSQRPRNTGEILSELARLEQIQNSPPGVHAVPPTRKIALPTPSAIKPTSPDFTLERTLIGHQDGVWSVALSPRGHILVTGSWDKTIKVWNVATGQLLRTLMGHQEAVWSVAVTADGKTLASGSSDQQIKIWNLPTGQLIHTLTGHSNWVAAVDLSPDGTLIASGSSDKTIKVWSVQSGELIHTLQGHRYAVTCIAFTPDGKTLVSGSGDKTLKIWSLTTGECFSTFTGHRASVTCLAISPDGKTGVSGDVKQTLCVWDLETQRLSYTLTGHSGTIWSVAIAPDGEQFVSSSRDKTVKIWNLQTGELRSTLMGHRSAINGVAIAPSGKVLVSASHDQTIKIWRSASPLSTAAIGS
ncbi:serine/threonine-protein kinase [Laspinema olomoucense]|uniref:serine/threonine-protein kinase n=1 Tax=Laspinema olomoucense TaxID=3231600 RepID=UPI0021BA8261|nr:serine/threonine-protein kinase [Laspinema sp. D3c]MCT7994495.1 serine/threonine protein kinase [Laspinema sp. D3c]